MSINLGGTPSNEGQMTLPKNGQTTIGGHYNGHEKEQTTYATIGNGKIIVGGEAQANTAGLNRDVNNAQEITQDIEIGGMDASVTVDHRLVSEEGREDIANNFEDSFEHGEDIATATQSMLKEEDLGILNFGETLHNNALLTQLKNDLLRNPENKELVANLTSENEEVKAQGIKDLGHLAQVKFGLELSEINLYDGEKTTSASLADHKLRDVKGAVVIDSDNAQAGNIQLDVGNNDLTGTDLMNTLGHEVLETQAYQGEDGLFFGPNDDATQEALGNAAGAQFADRISQAVSESGGDLDGSYTTQSNLNLKNSQAVAEGTKAANQVGSAAVDYRQATKGEILLIDRIADNYAKQKNISPDKARSILTQQALSMIDEKWAAQTHIEENADARAYLVKAAKEDGSLHYDSNGAKHLAFELAKREDFGDSQLNNSHVNEIENQGASEGGNHPVSKGWFTQYATENGTTPQVEDGVTKDAFQSIGQDIDTLLHEKKVIDVVADIVQGLYHAITDLPKEGAEGNKVIAELQGDRAELVQHEKVKIVDSVAMVAEVVGASKIIKLLPDGAGKGSPSDAAGDSGVMLDGGAERNISTTQVGNVVPNKAWKDKSIFNAYPERAELSMSGIDEQAAFLSRHVPGLGNEQATLILNHGFKRDSSVVIGGSRVRGDFVDGSDIDIGFGGFTEKQHQNVVKSINKATSLNSEFLNLEKLQIVPGKSTATIDPIVSPEEFFQRSGIRSANDGKKAGQPYVPSGSITLTSDGKIVVIPPGAGL